MKNVYLIFATIITGIFCLVYDISNMRTETFQQWVISAVDDERTLTAIRGHANEFCDEPRIAISEGVIIISVTGCEKLVASFSDRDAVFVYNEDEKLVALEGRRYTYFLSGIFFTFFGVWFTYLLVSRP